MIEIIENMTRQEISEIKINVKSDTIIVNGHIKKRFDWKIEIDTEELRKHFKCDVELLYE